MGIGEMTIGGLEMRRGVAQTLIKMLERESMDGETDKRMKGAIAELQRQQRKINEVLVAKIREERAARGEAEPEPVVVGMKPIVIRGRALR